jgi:hypothetical protein
MGAPECYHFVCTKGSGTWVGAPLKGDDQPAASLEGAEAPSLDELAKKLIEVIEAAKGEPGRTVCNVITPTKALFTSTIGGIVVASSAPVAGAAAAAGGAAKAEAKPAAPVEEEEEEAAGDFDLFD